MITTTEIDTLSKDEQQLLKAVRNAYGKSGNLVETILESRLYIQIPSERTENHIEIFYDNTDIVLSIGKWTHSHPESIEELIAEIEKIKKDKIIVWKVTRPDGYWYSGHYDIDEWKKNSNMVDEPDSNIEKNDRIERSTFNEQIEDRIIE